MHVLLQNLLSFPQSQMWARTVSAKGVFYFDLLDSSDVLDPNSKRFGDLPVQQRSVLYASQNDSTNPWAIAESTLSLLDSENLLKATRLPIELEDSGKTVFVVSDFNNPSGGEYAREIYERYIFFDTPSGNEKLGEAFNKKLSFEYGEDILFFDTKDKGHVGLLKDSEMETKDRVVSVVPLSNYVSRLLK
eukprot:GHVU01102976.1.p1 GENE.GHVU01102976.1~~GHVU01102976.1.p1  ORF type:complete len:190 (-),score=23.69 GHVU01102976.1:703-1272(-)